MKKDFDAAQLNVPAFAQAAAALSGAEPLAAFERLRAEASPQYAQDALGEVRWSARGELRTATGGGAVPWLHLQASATVPLVCQRCLQPMQEALAVDRWFRFVADEETAALEDEEAEEDVLVVSRRFDLRALLEDELLMELPVAPRHEVCPQAVPMAAQDADFDAAGEEQPHPFAALEQLKKKPPGQG